jgi:hypothetical protein
VAAFALATWLVRPAVLRRRLGLVHPAIAWLGLTAVFFGAGSALLAITGGSVGPALYVGGCVLGFGMGVWASDWLAGRRGGAASVEGIGSVDGPGGPKPGTRGWMPAVLAGVALLAVAPTLADSGIPFLATDITGSRAELTGIPIQLVRVGLPGLAAMLLFDGLRTVDRRRRLLAGIGIAAIAGFTILLASRYLVLELVGALAIAWLLAGRRLPRNVVIALAAVVVIGFGGIQIVRAYDEASGDPLAFAIDRSVNRVLLIQPRTLDALQGAIPTEQPYYLGLTWIHRLGPLVGRPDIPNLGYWIYPRVVEGAQETAGYAAPGLIGEAWANFGPAGIALFVALGAVAERLGALAAARRKRDVDVVAGALAILFLARTNALGLGGLAILGTLVLVWRLFAGPVAGLGGDLRRILAWRA